MAPVVAGMLTTTPPSWQRCASARCVPGGEGVQERASQLPETIGPSADPWDAVSPHCPATQGDYAHAALEASEQLPHLPRGRVLHHARWHQDWAQLELRKRMAIAAWRQSRDAAAAARKAHSSLLQVCGGVCERGMAVLA